MKPSSEVTKRVILNYNPKDELLDVIVIRNEKDTKYLQIEKDQNFFSQLLTLLEALRFKGELQIQGLSKVLNLDYKNFDNFKNINLSFEQFKNKMK